MCGIFGYTGKQTVNKLVFNGLKRLEYRGYDSWGIAVLNENKIYQYKDVGLVKQNEKLEKLPKSNLGIGHTRWATHGGVTKINAHPHISTARDFTLVQNGIVENFDSLKKELKKEGVQFKSQTDTEVIVKLVEREIEKGGSLKEALINAFKQLEGRNTVAVLDAKENKIYAIKNGSPLVIGISNDGTYLASDSLSFSPHTNKIVVLDDYDMVEIKGEKFNIYNIENGERKNPEIKILKYQYEDIDRGGYEHFMLKEIVEQQKTILYATDYTEKELKPLVNEIKKSRKVFLLGAGTAGFAAAQIAYFLRTIAKVDALDIKSYEFKSYLPIISSDDLIIAVSQSGETADTIEPLEVFKEMGCKIASIVNMYGTTISRMSDFEYYTNAGPEICVASTKVFTSQSAWGYLLAMTVANEHTKAHRRLKTLTKSLHSLFTPEVFEYIEGRLCPTLKDNEHFFILGKGENAAIALEGALKIKEISYKHVEGFSAGELKHGVIALIEKGTPVFGIIPSNENPEDNKDLISAMEQVKARGALTIGIGSEEFSDLEIFDHYISTPQINSLGSISNVIPFQLISYFLSLLLGNNIDKPRNLAKSVTVK
jgi:glucosamine--fructose-6-phosphate aminotransferase (isomerizing)